MRGLSRRVKILAVGAVIGLGVWIPLSSMDDQDQPRPLPTPTERLQISDMQLVPRGVAATCSPNVMHAECLLEGR